MAYTYHGVELVNCSPPRRRGPLTHFPFGKYSGRSIEDIIRSNPSYILWAVKEWLDLTPSQAGLFEVVTGGGIIPDRYIKESPPKVVSPIREKQESPPREEDIPWMSWGGLVDSPSDIIPNHDFWPNLAPGWWESFKKECEGKKGKERRTLYDDYRKKELKEMMKEWEKEYEVYRKNNSR